ncbi:helix-turn-helix domain-containing protein [Arthrobacter sp. KNU-44]|uniref:helix-turn-helix domain-containing protein n=1 Tax=Arthrobacter sp. KNU-44 TaxID=3450744 RepID=UPI003F445297
MSDVEFDTLDEAVTFVRERRKALHLTRAQLAENAGVSREFVVALERGQTNNESGQTLQVLTAVGFRIRA